MVHGYVRYMLVCCAIGRGIKQFLCVESSERECIIKKLKEIINKICECDVTTIFHGILFSRSPNCCCCWIDCCLASRFAVVGDIKSKKEKVFLSSEFVTAECCVPQSN